MPLSEHEQHMLEQMERALYAEDPTFATSMKGSERKRPGLHIIGGIVLTVAGLGCILLGITLSQPLVGGLGFALMVGGVAWAVTPARTRGSAQKSASSSGGQTPRGKRAKGQKRQEWMRKIEQRWEDRRRER